MGRLLVSSEPRNRGGRCVNTVCRLRKTIKARNKIVFGKVNPKYGMNFFFMGSDKKKLANFVNIRLNY